MPLPVSEPNTITADRQIEFRGLHIADANPYRVQQLEGLFDVPDLRIGDFPLAARHGMTAGQDYLGGRTITLTVDVTDDSEAAYTSAVRALIDAFQPTNSEAPFMFQLPGVADGGVVQVNARTRRRSLPIDFEYWRQHGRVIIELFATDPRIYSQVVSLERLPIATPSGGLTFNLTFNAAFGSGGNVGIKAIVNEGNFPAPVFARIYGPVTNPSLRNETLDRAVTVGMTLAVGEFLDIDFAARAVLLGGTSSRYSFLTKAEWWDLAPGANEVRYSASAVSASTAEIYYRSTWI